MQEQPPWPLHGQNISQQPGYITRSVDSADIKERVQVEYGEEKRGQQNITLNGTNFKLQSKETWMQCVRCSKWPMLHVSYLSREGEEKLARV